MIDARRRKASADAMPAKNMPGRKAGEDHARSQGPLRGDENSFKIRRKAPRNIDGRKAGQERPRSQCPLRGEDLQYQSPSLASLCYAKASLAFGEASSGYAGRNRR
ncbi:hypothetical protein V511_10245 [Mesotoga sp. Brook.08.YT.4.2.5.1]|nr:hypothetical protein V511_10245 [Mesotoga sp. Brook.08.YT.4.2.5.1]PNS40794.1 hypothetical protein RJ60_06205 [Mesotoga sp. B105.6.4]RAO96733.1 hypothetical protein M388_13225 [Mesotoga sp. Brook.08.YT.4.2.5.4.]RDI93319.1 hypothetical protein Q502_06550 [Mesotoga sp. Brook.08.YT.4.2.5.2.]